MAWPESGRITFSHASIACWPCGRRSRALGGLIIPSPTAHRQSEGIVMRIGHQPKEFLLAVEALTVSFDGFKAVNNLSFYVEENEIRVIIGPNGAGKTTVLDLICGKTKATSGSIRFRDKELTKMRENEIVQAGVGRKFQTPSIYDDLTVFENLEISFPRGRTVFGALTFQRDAVVKERVEEISEIIFLKDRLNVKAELLSHGQMQWLEIGMLLIQD